MTDLSPDVRAEAEIAGYRTYSTTTAGKHSDRWGQVVDAVTAVVAPEIERPLQARIEVLEARELLTEEQAGRMAEEIEELEGQVAKQEIAFQGRVLLEEMWRKEKVALQARIENLEAHNAEHRAQNDDLQARIEELEDRVMTLEAQRADLLERCRQADRSKSLPELSTGEVRRALGIPLLGGPDA